MRVDFPCHKSKWNIQHRILYEQSLFLQCYYSLPLHVDCRVRQIKLQDTLRRNKFIFYVELQKWFWHKNKKKFHKNLKKKMYIDKFFMTFFFVIVGNIKTTKKSFKTFRFLLLFSCRKVNQNGKRYQFLFWSTLLFYLSYIKRNCNNSCKSE